MICPLSAIECKNGFLYGGKAWVDIFRLEQPESAALALLEGKNEKPLRRSKGLCNGVGNLCLQVVSYLVRFDP